MRKNIKPVFLVVNILQSTYLLQDYFSLYRYLQENLPTAHTQWKHSGPHHKCSNNCTQAVSHVWVTVNIQNKCLITKRQIISTEIRSTTDNLSKLPFWPIKRGYVMSGWNTRDHFFFQKILANWTEWPWELHGWQQQQWKVSWMAGGLPSVSVIVANRIDPQK